MKFAIFSAILVICLMVVNCDETRTEDETQGNQLSEDQVEDFQNSLFKIFGRLGNSIHKNKTTTDDKNGNNLFVIKSLTLNFHLNSNKTEGKSIDSPSNGDASNSEILARMAELETISASMKQNLKSIDDQINALKSNYSKLAKDIRNNPENSIDPCITASTSGIYKIRQLHQNVYCEMTTFGGGWLVFQQRAYPFNTSFDRNWTDYQAGFGTIEKDSEYWLGLEALHQLTSRDEYELAVEMKDRKGNYSFARYSQFHVAGEEDKFRLTVGGHSGSLSDQMSEQNNMQFTTRDNDNDNYKWNCAMDYWNGGWWYNQCSYICAPNYGIGPYWHQFASQIRHSYGAYIRMMIRKK